MTAKASLPPTRENLPPERELKLLVPRERVPVVASWLASLCEADPYYPENEVVSIYFDTPDLRALGEKLNGDDRKTKLRLRWYEDPRRERPASAVFLEIKGRSGGTRFKVHQPLALSVAELRAAPLALLFPRELLAAAHQHGVELPGELVPVVELAYLRSRYREPWSGARIALDRGIRAARANPRLLPRSDAPELELAVLEAKGEGGELPERLRPLLALGCQPAAISKYALTLAALGGPGEEF